MLQVDFAADFLTNILQLYVMLVLFNKVFIFGVALFLCWFDVMW
jgi:hypothetical protein